MRERERERERDMDNREHQIGMDTGAKGAKGFLSYFGHVVESRRDGR